jgi:hypothetical protein
MVFLSYIRPVRVHHGIHVSETKAHYAQVSCNAKDAPSQAVIDDIERRIDFKHRAISNGEHPWQLTHAYFVEMEHPPVQVHQQSFSARPMVPATVFRFSY